MTPYKKLNHLAKSQILAAKSTLISYTKSSIAYQTCLLSYSFLTNISSPTVLLADYVAVYSLSIQYRTLIVGYYRFVEPEVANNPTD